MNENEQNFDTARESAERMLSQQPIEEERTVNNMLADELERKQEEQAVRERETEEAADTALTAAQTAQEQNNQNRQLIEENRQMQEQLQQMQQQIQAMNEQFSDIQKSAEQQNELQKKSLIENTLNVPQLDLSELAFADEDTAREIQSKYAEEMRDYMHSQIMDELSPYIKEAEQAREVKERTDVMNMLAQDDMFSDIKDNEEQITRLLSENGGKFAQDMDMPEKVAMAYIMTRGINAMNKSGEDEKSPSLNDLMKLYDNNSEFRAAIEEKRINSLNNSQQVPQMSASQGAANAALNIKEKPKNFDEAYDAVSKLFERNEK